MKRLVGVIVGLSLVLVAGCTRRYEARLNWTLDRLRYEQRLDQFLGQAEQAPFKELNLYLRPPKPLTKAQQPGLSADPNGYELNASFLDLSPAQPAAKAATASSPLRLHVLARVKRPKKTAKKGETPPPEPQRGEFTADVQALLGSEVPPAADDPGLSAPPKALKKGTNPYKGLSYKAGSGDTIKVYFLKQDTYDVALVWDIPTSVEKTSATGIDLCLESFAAGQKAVAKFAGGDTSEEGPAAEGAGSAGAGQSF